ncbi:peroxiredoxin family protein [Gemmata sp. G18]|uniref:thioredoxin-dependent peroxiredoxin n=1 Tax=Gemmata palustris TaxID=2822762 RepID=A0ABS5C472_9BACT|nr:redoxin domain-containing protein [Gemmata palustris]MBP3960772.1 peroxiredoxin family protein [Gemmata palustris]
MRSLTAAGLFALLAALAGCGGSSDLPAPMYGPPDLKAVAGRFHNKEPNRTVSGESMPLQFVDTNGKDVDLASFRGKSNVVLVVVKGMPRYPGGLFCPGCLAQVNALTANYDEFKKRDAEILMVFPGPKDKLPQFLHDGKVDGESGSPNVPFALLLDTDLKAVNALGIKGDLAKPSTYILDKKGNAVFAFVGEDTTDRPSVQSLLARLDKLNGKK